VHGHHSSHQHKDSNTSGNKVFYIIFFLALGVQFKPTQYLNLKE
jgi:predicted Kef-type K+ transport protein